MIVVDASVAVRAAMSAWPRRAGDLVAPALLWSEVPSALHEMRWRGAASVEMTDAALQRFLETDIEERRPRELTATAWEIADQLGWAKTYDAEYVALARLLDCALLTVDKRLKRGAASAARVIGPTEL